MQQIAFDRAAENPEAAQRNYLLALLRRNQDTAFGREHGFRGIQHATDYARRVPIRDYARHQPWIDRLKRGDKCVLTVSDPLMFATTSGTTSEPKFIPLTAEWLRELQRLTTLWLYRSQVDYPSLFDSKSVTVVSPAVESRTASGTPVGSVSGLTYQRTPWMVRRSYALPYDVSEITDYDDRYFVAARMAFAADVSMLAAPNPRLKKVGSIANASFARFTMVASVCRLLNKPIRSNVCFTRGWAARFAPTKAGPGAWEDS